MKITRNAVAPLLLRRSPGWGMWKALSLLVALIEEQGVAAAIPSPHDTKMRHA